jgi:hypothetical protein
VVDPVLRGLRVPHDVHGVGLGELGVEPARHLGGKEALLVPAQGVQNGSVAPGYFGGRGGRPRGPRGLPWALGGVAPPATGRDPGSSSAKGTGLTRERRKDGVKTA